MIKTMIKNIYLKILIQIESKSFLLKISPTFYLFIFYLLLFIYYYF